jgi:hypothetical protein
MPNMTLAWKSGWLKATLGSTGPAPGLNDRKSLMYQALNKHYPEDRPARMA